ncbi:MAG TPA: hypothetical protein VHD34_03840 [Xanthobacteraceae bacterium]|nr:hypothetical protein [Xanthobacteraceae bacterium]
MKSTMAILTGALTATVFTTALAAEEYYIVRQQGTDNCRIVEGRPSDDRMIIGRAYKSRSDAESDFKTVCKGP